MHDNRCECTACAVRLSKTERGSVTVTGFEKRKSANTLLKRAGHRFAGKAPGCARIRFE